MFFWLIRIRVSCNSRLSEQQTFEIADPNPYHIAIHGTVVPENLASFGDESSMRISTLGTKFSETRAVTVDALINALMH